ncbi:M67 family metallopeptidase [Pseudomonas sp. RW10S2]|uniref:Mov34/MPN/PAD-1 family protein n=1 Tax=Pseudomonas sp. RW10S2 TaxID=459637 RepID=UPI001644AE07|nr:M67 family metallopeptidase [Pseudomonas sp. RW10S2]MBC3465127.1 M67 family metallopeptidase [Pseudomonas sp. RW10S2]QXI41374.1 M67 family metallopeptidase [Pseudomonas wayambapalatensis]
MLIISRALLDAAMTHAQQQHPLEACGVMPGRQGTDRPSRWVPMVNHAGSQTFFQFEPREQLRVWREMDAQQEEPVVIYHSHTASDAYPSRADIDFANEPHTHYLILSTASGCEYPVRSYRIANGQVIEESLRIVDVDTRAA